MIDQQTQARLRTLMFYTVPDPDEKITDEVLAKTEAVGYEEGQKLKAEFRMIVESLGAYPEIRTIVLEALDGIKAAGEDATGNDTEWMNTCDVLGRRIRLAIKPLLD
jgi:hypothetical protein